MYVKYNSGDPSGGSYFTNPESMIDEDNTHDNIGYLRGPTN